MQTTEFNKELELRERELFRPLWEAQIKLFFEASTITATIAIATDESVKKTAISKFWVLYNGPLIIVEDQAISGAMKSFGDCLKLEEKGCSLHTKSRILATKILESLEKSWGNGLKGFSKDKFKYSN